MSSKKPNKHGYKILSGISKDVYGSILELSSEDMRALIAVADELTDTNCSWQAYGLAPAVKSLTQTALEWREAEEGKTRARTKRGES